MENGINRNKKIIRTSALGIGVNALMVLIKLTVGLFTNSIAIILDAINNFSDALSSIITIVATKLAGKAPDKKHPYGYGRVEYLSTIIIAGLILIAGGTSVKESIEAIINGEKAEYSTVTLVLIAIAIVVKFLSGRYVKKVGKEIQANSLIASGQEALYDCVLSIGTLVAALVAIFTNVSIEGYIGIGISLLIIKTGVEMMVETLSVIIGNRTDRELTARLRDMVNNYPQVNGTYDIILHNYGPSQHIGSVHIEVDESMDARSIHILTRKITADVYAQMGIILTLGIYSSNNNDPEAVAMKNDVLNIIREYPEVLQMHGFFLHEKTAGFDLVIAFKSDAMGIINEVKRRLEDLHPDYSFSIILDLDFSD